MVKLINVQFGDYPKKYTFRCDYENIRQGDFIKSPDYKDVMQVKEIKYVEDYNETLVKTLRIAYINGKPMNNNNNNNNMFDKYKTQFIPQKATDIKLSMDGNICIEVNDKYVGIDSNNNIIEYPKEMCLDFPVYLIGKPFSKVKIGDIIQMDNSYAKVLKIKNDSSLTCLSYTGVSQNQKEIKDYLLQQSFVKVVVNLFDNNSDTFNNPLMLMALSEETDMKDILMLQMMQQNNTDFAKNPMLMMMLLSDKKDNSMKDILMLQMMQQNIFNNSENK